MSTPEQKSQYMKTYYRKHKDKISAAKRQRRQDEEPEVVIPVVMVVNGWPQVSTPGLDKLKKQR